MFAWLIKSQTSDRQLTPVPRPKSPSPSGFYCTHRRSLAVRQWKGERAKIGGRESDGERGDKREDVLRPERGGRKEEEGEGGGVTPQITSASCHLGGWWSEKDSPKTKRNIAYV